VGGSRGSSPDTNFDEKTETIWKKVPSGKENEKEQRSGEKALSGNAMQKGHGDKKGKDTC